MTGRSIRVAGWAVCLGVWCTAQTLPTSSPAPAKPSASDDLGRDNPRSAVTGFLEACRSGDYQKASQYLDLSQLSPRYRESRGPELAKMLEGILNSDRQFNLLRLNRNPQGDLTDDPDPNREHVATVTQQNGSITLDLDHTTQEPGGPQIWLFSRDTIAALPSIQVSAPPAIERYLPTGFGLAPDSGNTAVGMAGADSAGPADGLLVASAGLATGIADEASRAAHESSAGGCHGWTRWFNPRELSCAWPSFASASRS